VKLLQKILVPVDFNESSQRAIDTAVMLARSFHSHISLLHVLSPGNISQDAQALLEAYTREKLEAMAASIRENGVASSDYLIRQGIPFETIIDVAQYSDFNVIVAGAGNKRDDESFQLGTTAEKLMRKNQVPLWVVKNNDPLTIQSILCPVDFSDASARALGNAITLADVFQAKLTVLNVYQPIEVLSPRFNIDPVAENKQRSRRQEKEFEAFLNDFKLDRVNHEILTLEGEPHAEILKLIQERKIELLVMGTVGRSGLSRLLMGSVTEKVTRNVPCSFITTKARDLTHSFLESSIRNVEEILHAAVRQLEEGDAEAAAELYVTGLRQYPDNIPLLKGLIATYESTGNKPMAEQYRRHAEEVLRRTWGEEYLGTLRMGDGSTSG
jgi:nucleotide-binding universal stress UspA family protein